MATLTATADAAHSPPRVQLDLAWAGQASATILRHDPDGRIRPVRDGDPVTLASGVAPTVYDYESWFGAPTVYEALAPGGATVSSAAVTLDVQAVWLRHPLNPGVSMPVDYTPEAPGDYAANRAVFTPIGRPDPIVVTDGVRRAKHSTMNLRVNTLDERDALTALFADCGVLLLDVPPAWAWGIVHEYRACGDLTETRLAPDIAPEPTRILSCEFHVVDRPVGGLTAARSYGDLLDEADSYAGLLVEYDTYADVLAGTPR